MSAEFSITKRLIITTTVVASLLVIISTVWTFYETRHEINEIYDARLGQSAKILALSMKHLLNEPFPDQTKIYADWYSGIQIQAAGRDDTPTQYGHAYEQNLMFQVFDEKGSLLLRSPGAPVSLFVHSTAQGYIDFDMAEEAWRSFLIAVPVLSGDSTSAYLLVAEKRSVRDELMDDIALSTVVPQLVLIPLLALVIVILSNKFLRPIRELKQAVAQRSINKLDSISVPNPTVELNPLIAQLNALFSELDKAWQREKRFTHTAAHELKTPLAVLRLNTENALNSRNKDELHADLQQVLAGIERSDRLIQQLLMLSRIESRHDIQFEPFDLITCLQDAISGLAPFALKQQQTLSLNGPDKMVIKGNPTLLLSLFSNLIDNAVRYSGAGSVISVNVTETDSLPERSWVKVQVTDSGVSIPPSIHHKIFEKFFRAHSEQGDGAGLGMSVVLDIVNFHDGQLQLLQPDYPQGNTFEVCLPKGC
ncbi:ATP-binding protein [Photobacterium sp.]|uniref:ATP-binding protein n=1 Tax=Photobacterium sp. TaxID=660 RepID=UPI00299F1D2A|nr:ATP-binding protein [Photobacterium sp.]MDX1302227.1 ATP-binding protein [Photobacterium sp.]